MRQLGDLKLHAISDGTFALDGGAMFGIVPKPLWEKQIPADDKNRIRLALRCLLIEAGQRRILVDDGMGEKWSDKQVGIYGLDRSETSLDRELARVGVDRAAITDVILTHLHFDHAGGTTRRGAGGQLELAFPNATYHLQSRNWEWARHPTERDAGSYLSDSFDLLEGSGRLHLVDGEVELFPGIHVEPSEGHTTALQLVRVSGGGETLVYCADLIPTSAHIKVSWIMGYDLRPLVCIEEKKRLLSRALAGNWMLFFEHDPQIAACRVRPSTALGASGIPEAVRGDVVAL
jgi:glyoxylase-like metal-dependent hydrolase (beta-lactamase superfamily II)